VATGSRLAKPPRSGAHQGGLEAVAASWTIVRRGRWLRAVPGRVPWAGLICGSRPVNRRARAGRASPTLSPAAGAPAAPPWSRRLAPLVLANPL